MTAAVEAAVEAAALALFRRKNKFLVNSLSAMDGRDRPLKN